MSDDTTSPAKGQEDLRTAALALADAVMTDEGGLPGYPGHGGLLSRETIRLADTVRRICSKEGGA